jgi:glycosyltransferase involved in cell wall biosynthesis
MQYRNFKRPYNDSKVISLIHSCGSCLPAIDNDQVVTITYTWKGVMQQKNIESQMIYAGIDNKIYDIEKDYSKKTFGRITRYSRGKVHPKFNNIMLNVLNKLPDSEAHIISNNYPPIEHKRLKIYRNIKINEEKKKAKYLSKINMFTDAHFTFIETFSLCLLEAMASGCCIVMLKGQPAMEEIVGKAGFICVELQEFENTILQILQDSDRMKEMGLKAKQRALDFTQERMIQKWDNLFKDILK